MQLHRVFNWNICAASLLLCNIACAQTIAPSQSTAPLSLKNADFEDGLNGWTTREKVSMSALNAQAAHSGKMGLRVLDNDGSAGSNALSSPVPITGGQGYQLKFWAKTASSNAAVVQFRFYDSDRKGIQAETVRLPIKTTDNQWAQLDLTDRAPQNATTLAVWIHSYSGAKATLDFDDFSLQAASNTETASLPVPPVPIEKVDAAPAKTIKGPRLSPPYIMIKADDLRAVNGRPHARWKKFADFIRERKIHASIGIICNSLEGDNPVYTSWIKEQQATGLFEFWNHGYVHEPTEVNGEKVQEFKGPSYETQKEHFMRSQALAKEKLGFPLATFGAPSNSFDENTVRVLSEDPDTKVWLYGDDKHPAGKLVLDRIYPVNIENPLFLPSLDKFVEGYNKYPQREYFVIQGHAAKWDDARFEQFTKIVDFLIAQKAIFVTPSEYAKIKATPAP